MSAAVEYLKNSQGNEPTPMDNEYQISTLISDSLQSKYKTKRKKIAYICNLTKNVMEVRLPQIKENQQNASLFLNKNRVTMGRLNISRQ